MVDTGHVGDRDVLTPGSGTAVVLLVDTGGEGVLLMVDAGEVVAVVGCAVVVHPGFSSAGMEDKFDGAENSPTRQD